MNLRIFFLWVAMAAACIGIAAIVVALVFSFFPPPACAPGSAPGPSISGAFTIKGCNGDEHRQR